MVLVGSCIPVQEPGAIIVARVLANCDLRCLCSVKLLDRDPLHKVLTLNTLASS